MKLCLLLVLLCLPALSLATYCRPGATLDSGCSDCADETGTSDCNWCRSGHYKTGPKTCTPCPENFGRIEPSVAITGVETSAVCFKCSPQLNCKNCGSSPFSCISCAAGAYIEYGEVFGSIEVSGCSTDCKSFSGKRPSMVPNTQTPASTYCTQCGSNCAKCAYTTLKEYVGQTETRSQATICETCNPGFFLQANKDPTVVPSCAICGANCKKCKDRTECTECFPGWAFDGSAKDGCTKAVASSASLLQGALLSIFALFIAW